MRVALFTETFLPKTDGIVTVMCLLLDHLTARGIETVVVAPQMGVSAYRQTPVIGVPGITLPLYPELRFGPPTLATYRRLKAFQPDVAHVFAPALVGGFGLLMAKRLGLPTVASFHLDVARLTRHFGIGAIAPFARWLTRRLFNWADAALAPSRAVMADMQAMGIRRVGLWGRGVDTERFHPRFASAAMRRWLAGGAPDGVILLYVGRLSAEKRLFDLKPVLETVPGTRLALVGDGPARGELQACFAGLPAQFMGYLHGEALAAAYASADVFVFPSALETFGLVVLEAMAAGLPVVASRVGGVGDVVQDGLNGWTFAAGDVAALVAGVRELAADPERRRQMRVAARAAAEAHTWPGKMEEVVALYERLIAAKTARAGL